MPVLTFPTQAEQALEEFNSATKTVSLATIAKARGGQVNTIWKGSERRTEYTFDDDSVLCVKGTGKNHQAWTELP